MKGLKFQLLQQNEIDRYATTRHCQQTGVVRVCGRHGHATFSVDTTPVVCTKYIEAVCSLNSGVNLWVVYPLLMSIHFLSIHRSSKRRIQ